MAGFSALIENILVEFWDNIGKKPYIISVSGGGIHALFGFREALINSKMLIGEGIFLAARQKSINACCIMGFNRATKTPRQAAF